MEERVDWRIRLNGMEVAVRAIQHDRHEDGTITAAVSGDRAAIDALWEQHRRWVAAVLLAHKPALDDLDDLLQDVAMTMVTKLHTLRDHRHLRAWLRTVAINVARASARSARSRPVIHTPDLDTSQPSLRLHNDAAQQDETSRILEMVQELPEAYREPLVLRALHGMRSRQISEIMDIPEATVDTRVARARRMLLEMTQKRACGQPLADGARGL